MGRPRAFDQDATVRAAARLFADRGFEGTSVDDLVTGLAVHRGSLYKVFGSKRGLYLAALRQHLDHEVLPMTAALAAADGPALDLAVAGFDGGPAEGLLLLAAAERAPHDPEVAALVAEGLSALERALGHRSGDPALAPALVAAVLGLRLRARAGGGSGADAVRALTDQLKE
ncbi:helix-turn-helix domain-containing protein [Kitasatospora sp. NPDC002040]|uniref:TetR/AcrR family transcriptional regulator n=1 Tax=Kitasatospora sp. NPDC002040 TaxID=3154661 RepID=UPI0033208535